VFFWVLNFWKKFISVYLLNEINFENSISTRKRVENISSFALDKTCSPFKLNGGPISVFLLNEINFENNISTRKRVEKISSFALDKTCSPFKLNGGPIRSLIKGFVIGI
jgi:hypothetical protein